MSHELFYTSAPKGLQPGSRGFCTVACTAGIPAPLVEKVESLSGYRPLFPPNDPRAALSPVNYSHLQVNVGGRTYHILSRTCFAGLDYTDRTNKFAHHVILEPHELPAGGPAWLMRQPRFMESRWDGQVRQLPAGRVPPRGATSSGVCAEWQKLTGDAGWAGVAVESFLKDPDRPVFLLFEPGTDLLPLVAEAVALLPADQRWNVSFSTYMSGLPAGMNCTWRGMVKSSEEAAAAKRSPAALVISVGEKMGRAVGGPMVDAARTGRAPAAAMMLPASVIPPPVPVSAMSPGGSPARIAPLPLSAQGTTKVKPSTTPAMPPPPVPMPMPDEGGRKGSRAGFGIGMMAGVLLSAIPVAALAMTGLIIVTPLMDIMGKDTGRSALLAQVTEKDTGRGVETTTREAGSGAFNNVLDGVNKKLKEMEKERDAALNREDKLKETVKDRDAKLAALDKQTPDPKGKEQQATTAELEKEKQKNADLTKERDKLKGERDKLKGEKDSLIIERDQARKPKQVERPPDAVRHQFDYLDQNGLELKLKPSEKCGIQVVSMEDVYDFPKEGGIKHQLKLEKGERELRFVLYYERPGEKQRPQKIDLAKFQIDQLGKLRFHKEQIEANRPEKEKQFASDIQNRLASMLPNQVLELRTPDLLYIGLRKPETGKARVLMIAADLSANWHSKLTVEGFGPGEGQSPSLEFEGPWSIHGLKRLSPQGIKYKPGPGASLFMAVKGKWLVELVHYE